MSLLFISVYTVWIASEILINRLFKSKSTDKQNLDGNTLKIIWITIIVAVSMSVTIANYFYNPIYPGRAILFIGLILIVLGCIVRFLCIQSLGRQFTADVTIRQEHQLKTDGMYKYIRHPSYAASLLSFIGFGLSLNNWISFLLLTISVIIAFNIRIKVEENALITHFGSAYVDYKKNTFRLLPFLL